MLFVNKSTLVKKIGGIEFWLFKDIVYRSSIWISSKICRSVTAEFAFAQHTYVLFEDKNPPHPPSSCSKQTENVLHGFVAAILVSVCRAKVNSKSVDRPINRSIGIARFADSIRMHADHPIHDPGRHARSSQWLLLPMRVANWTPQPSERIRHYELWNSNILCFASALLPLTCISTNISFLSWPQVGTIYITQQSS